MPRSEPGSLLYESVKAEIEKLFASIQTKLADGKLSLGEIGSLFREVLETAVILAEQTNVPGPRKKALAIEIVLAFWDDILEPFDLPYLPDRLVDPIIRSALPHLVGWLIDYIVGVNNVRGWRLAA